MSPSSKAYEPMFGNRTAPDGSLAHENFANWFGASQVTDPAGMPLTVYHGTDKRFTRFSAKLLGVVSDTTDAKQGFWFSSSYSRAQQAASDAKTVNESHESWVMPVYLRITNPLVIHDPIRGMDPAESGSKIRRARAAGHDGVVFVAGEGNGSDFVVFTAAQIKSTENNGAFNPDSGCITDSVESQPTTRKNRHP